MSQPNKDVQSAPDLAESPCSFSQEELEGFFRVGLGSSATPQQPDMGVSQAERSRLMAEMSHIQRRLAALGCPHDASGEVENKGGCHNVISVVTLHVLCSDLSHAYIILFLMKY